MKLDDLTPLQRSTRQIVRAFLLTASQEQLEAEVKLSEQSKDTFRAECIRELIRERQTTVNEGMR